MDVMGSNVVVTGGTGFLGRYVAEQVRQAGADVHALGSDDYDLRRRDAIEAMLSDLHPEAVIHLAAVVGGIGANRAEPGRFLYENALMGIELLEACRLAGTAKVIVAGTVCAYPKFAAVPFSEDALWDGYPEETNAPYGIAKRMLLVQGQAYRAQYDMNVVHLLPVNLYGPHDSFDLENSHVVPGMIRRFMEARERGDDEVVLWGDGTPTREFLHASDAARAFRLALEHYDGSEPVNVGSGHEVSIADLSTIVADAVGFSGRVVWDTEKPNGQPRRCLDTSRARELFGFEATVPFADGIRETVEWYAASVAGRIS